MARNSKVCTDVQSQINLSQLKHFIKTMSLENLTYELKDATA